MARKASNQSERSYAAGVSRQKSKDAREIDEIPPVKDVARKARCRTSFEAFCLSYFPHTFTLPFSGDHGKVIAKIELAVIQGGLFAMAMPRGSGKTTLAEIASLWAILYGHRAFVMLVGADADSASQMLESIKTELETNDALFDDFPEVAHPIRELEGEPRRCKGQTYKGERTRSVWSQGVIVLPTIPGSAASGSIVRVAGITGRIRGQKFKRADGKSVRPSLVVCDDPQTDESSASASQCNTRERTLAGAILGLAGPGKSISGIMPCTVIRKGDMADRILDTKLHPEWNGSRFKLIYEFPTDKDAWERYRELLITYDPSIPGDKERAAREATMLYAEHSAEMDAGAVVGWKERFKDDEFSAVQHAMNLMYQDERAFFAEYQNEPLPEIATNPDDLTSVQVAGKINGRPRGQIPIDASRLTAFIDVQGKLLYYVVCAWCEDFTGYVVDYGTWPDQKRPYFVLDDVQKTFATETKVVGQEAQIYAGLERLTTVILGKEWQREGGSGMRIERCNVDAGYQTDTIYQFCKQSPYSAILTPSHGKGIGASSQPITARQKKSGERFGLNWVMPLGGKRAKQYVLADVNFWKSFVHARLAVPMGGSGCLSIFGDSPGLHRMFADHVTAESRNPTLSEKTNRKVDEWHAPPGVENHFFDGLVGCAVAAEMLGVSLDKVHTPHKPAGKRERVSFAEMQARARQKAGR